MNPWLAFLLGAICMLLIIAGPPFVRGFMGWSQFESEGDDPPRLPEASLDRAAPHLEQYRIVHGGSVKGANTLHGRPSQHGPRKPSRKRR